MWILYQILFVLSLLLSAPVLLLRRGSHYLATLAGRLGRPGETPNEGALWLHAVSVGEVGVAATLAEGISVSERLLITTITPTGQAQARRQLGVRGAITYLPFDLGFAIRRFLNRYSPRGLVLVEGDYWPLLLHHVGRRGIPVVVVNGRVGDRSFQRLRRLRPLLKPLFSQVKAFGMQTDADRERLISLGVPADRVQTTGNLKYETREPERNPQLEQQLRELAGDRTVLVAGSTMRGEEELVLGAFDDASAGGSLFLILAPRHPERWDEVAALLDTRGRPWLRRSGLANGAPADILLLDSLGELANLYRLAGGAFIGGTLVPTGGHNPLEAARFGTPVAVGPSMENFREIAEHFDAAAAWARVANPAALAAVWRQWSADPDIASEIGARGQALVDRNRGALRRTLAAIRGELDLTT